jgi:phospholipid N-methyltransferase
MTKSLHAAAAFLKEFGRQSATTGSVIPSSRFLAQAITRELGTRTRSPLRILECGPGTGAFTNHIVRHLESNDVLDLVEINETFVTYLRHRFRNDPHWQSAAHQTSIHAKRLQEFLPSEPYDFIISGLPHINFPIPVLAEIIASYHRLLKPGGRLSYFEYMYIRPIRRVATLGWDSCRIDQVDSLMNTLLATYDSRREDVFLNFPPAWVRHLARGSATPVDADRS